jgi:hypothetical protein
MAIFRVLVLYFVFKVTVWSQGSVREVYYVFFSKRWLSSDLAKECFVRLTLAIDIL